jgi:hypothetical protein
MLTSISWGEYTIMVIIALAIYYTYVGFHYFRWEILSLIGIKKVEDNVIAVPAFSNVNQVIKTEHPEDYLPKTNLETDISPLIQSFTDEVQAYLLGANPNMQQSELLYSLQLIASKYPVLKNADCRDELLQMIFMEVNSKHPGMFELSDLKPLWK